MDNLINSHRKGHGLWTTQRRLDQILRECLAVGYEALTDDEKEICDAYDAGKLNVMPDERYKPNG